jgi:hypothetical protein
LDGFRTGSYLLARAAIPTDASEDAVYDLNEAQDEFDSTKSQEDGEQGYVPLHDVLGFIALGPRGGVHEVPVERKRNLGDMTKKQRKKETNKKTQPQFTFPEFQPLQHQNIWILAEMGFNHVGKSRLDFIPQRGLACFLAYHFSCPSRTKGVGTRHPTLKQFIESTQDLIH